MTNQLAAWKSADLLLGSTCHHALKKSLKPNSLVRIFFEFWSFQPFLINRRVLNSSIFDIFFASNRNLLSNLGVLTINCHLSIDPIFSKFGMLAHF